MPRKFVSCFAISVNHCERETSITCTHISAEQLRADKNRTAEFLADRIRANGRRAWIGICHRRDDDVNSLTGCVPAWSVRGIVCPRVIIAGDIFRGRTVPIVYTAVYQSVTWRLEGSSARVRLRQLTPRRTEIATPPSNNRRRSAAAPWRVVLRPSAARQQHLRFVEPPLWHSPEN